MFPEDDIDWLHARVTLLEDKAAARTFLSLFSTAVLLGLIWVVDHRLTQHREEWGKAHMQLFGANTTRRSASRTTFNLSSFPMSGIKRSCHNLFRTRTRLLSKLADRPKTRWRDVTTWSTGHAVRIRHKHWRSPRSAMRLPMFQRERHEPKTGTPGAEG